MEFIKSLHYEDEIKTFYSNSLSSALQQSNMFNNKYKSIISIKTHKKNWFMKWHIDDCQLIKVKDINTLQKPKNGGIYAKNNKYALIYQKSLPKYTLLYYTDDENTKGGDLQFPHKRITPKNNLTIIFPSNIPHCVHPLREGTRKNVIVKFY